MSIFPGEFQLHKNASSTKAAATSHHFADSSAVAAAASVSAKAPNRKAKLKKVKKAAAAAAAATERAVGSAKRKVDAGAHVDKRAKPSEPVDDEFDFDDNDDWS